MSQHMCWVRVNMPRIPAMRNAAMMANDAWTNEHNEHKRPQIPNLNKVSPPWSVRHKLK